MSRRLGLDWAAALASGIGLAAVGAVVAYTLAGSPWAGVGAIIGAVTGAFAPSLYDGIRKRSTALELWRGTLEKVPPQSWSRLLDPRREVVSFIGREAELAALMAWCGDERSGQLRLVSGPGGIGKTRLAAELSQRMTESGWSCQRVADGKEGAVIGALRAVTYRPTLLTVDYAETRTGLQQMLGVLASDRRRGLKVLLLARSAGDWWDQLGVGQPQVWDLVQSAKSAEVVLSPVIASDLSDADIIARAVGSFARELDVRERIVEFYGGGTGRRRVLDLHAAALVAVLEAEDTVTARVDLGTVLSELLRHEMHFWYESAKSSGLTGGPAGLSMLMLRQIVAAGCLLGAATEAEAGALPSRVPGLSASPRVARWLRELYPPGPGEPDWLGSLQPDRLAELHVVRELADSPELARACLNGLNARQAQRAVMLLARASSDAPQAETLLRQTLPQFGEFIGGLDASPDTLIAIINAIPYPTVILAPAAAAIAQRIVAHLMAGPTLRAYWLSILGIRLSGAYRPAEALPATEEAVAIYRELVAADPDRHRRDLADALDNLGTTLSERSLIAEALPVTEEAVALYRGLVNADPDRHGSGLASSLHHLSRLLSALDRPSDALAAEQESVAICRAAKTTPDRYRPDLAHSLNHLGGLLSAAGRPADALAAEQEAVAIFRELTAESPDSYRPHLAASLGILGVLLSEANRPADAPTVVEETVAAYRELAAVSPDRYRPALANSLSHLSMTFSEVGRLADALAAEQEAAAIYRELAAVSPDHYRPLLASSLVNVGVRFSKVGGTSDGVPAAEEAVAIYRELTSVSPDRYGPELAKSLGLLSAWLSGAGRVSDAVTVDQQMVAIYRQLAAASPDRYRPLLALSLSHLDVMLSAVGHSAEALPITEEAVAIYRELAAVSPDRYRPQLAATLDNLGIRLFAVDRPAEALPITEEAVAIFRELAAVSLDDYSLANSLSHFGIMLYAVRSPSEALPITEEAVAIYRELAAVKPGRCRLELAQSLTFLADVLATLSRHTDAQAARREAAKLSQSD